MLLISGLQKGPTESGHVKKREKSSKSVKEFFDNFRAGQKNVKNRQKTSKKFFDTFRQFSRGTFFPAPLIWGALISALSVVASCDHRDLLQESLGPFGPEVSRESLWRLLRIPVTSGRSQETQRIF